MAISRDKEKKKVGKQKKESNTERKDIKAKGNEILTEIKENKKKWKKEW